MNRKISTLFAALLIVAGLILISLPYLSNAKLEKESQKAVSIVTNEIAPEEIQANLEAEPSAEDFNFSAIEDIPETGTLLNVNSINKKSILGQIVIPSIDLNLVLLRGTTNANLLAGAGTMKPSQKMGEGNYAVAGHYAKRGVLFGDLTNVKKNAIIRITDKTTIYEYKVFGAKSVSPERVELISDIEAEKHGKPIISLMNCHYVNGKNTGNRYFVFGELVNSYEYSEDAMLSKDE